MPRREVIAVMEKAGAALFYIHNKIPTHHARDSFKSSQPASTAPPSTVSLDVTRAGFNGVAMPSAIEAN